MNSANLLEKFQQLAELDVYSWVKNPWPAKEDEACQALIAELKECDGDERSLLLDRIRGICLDQQLEVFAFRSGKFATERSDFENAYWALFLCQSKERLLVEAHIAAFAKAKGVNGKKLKSRLTDELRPGGWIAEAE